MTKKLINLFFFLGIVISLRSQNIKKKYKEKNIKLIKQEEKVNVDDVKENINEKINLLDDEHVDNIDLDGVIYVR